LIVPAPRAIGSARVRCRERLGGLLRYYHQADEVFGLYAIEIEADASSRER
jgi:hypothetical protein